MPAAFDRTQGVADGLLNTPSVASTIAPSSSSCPVPDDVCDKAAALRKAILVDKDFDWLIQNYPPSGFIVCNEDAPRPGTPQLPPHLCEGAGLNEPRPVYNLGGPISAEQYMAALRFWVESRSTSIRDDYGTADNRLYTVGCPEVRGKEACSDGFILVFSKLPVDGSEQTQLILFIEPRENGKVSTFIGSLPDGAHLAPALRGGTVYGFFGPSGRSTTFYALDQL